VGSPHHHRRCAERTLLIRFESSDHLSRESTTHFLLEERNDTMNRGGTTLRKRTVWLVLAWFLTGAAVCPLDTIQSPKKETQSMNTTLNGSAPSTNLKHPAPGSDMGLAGAPSRLETATFALG
jgi:hypothetical protein